MTDTLKIGTSLAGMAYLSTFFNDSRDREPRVEPMQYGTFYDAGDGSHPGVGWLTQKWVFGRLTEHYWAHLVAFKNLPVWITTRKNDGTYANYTAVAIFPDEEPEHWAGRVLDAEITFRAMVAL
jgi:hypothetical protein